MTDNNLDTQEEKILLQVRISRELRRKLRIYCAEQGISLSEFIRRQITNLELTEDGKREKR